jgi:hypothetical protein
MWPIVKKNLADLTDPWVLVSQAFIDPVGDTDYFPDLDWSSVNQPVEDDDAAP